MPQGEGRRSRAALPSAGQGEAFRRWRAQIPAGFQARSLSSSASEDAKRLCTSRASQTGNLSILTSSCLGRHKDEAASWAGAGAHGSPGWRRGDKGHKPRVRGSGGRFLSIPRTVPGGNKEQKNLGKLRQRGQPDRSRQARQPTASFPPPPQEAVPGAAAFPRGAHTAAGTGQDGGHKAPTRGAPLPSPALGSPPRDGSSPCQETFPAPALWARRGGRTTTLVLRQVSYGSDARAGAPRPLWHA